MNKWMRKISILCHIKTKTGFFKRRNSR